MKLIDILVEELPKRGGWPEGAVAITQDSDKAINNYKTSDGLETNEHGTWRYSSAWEGYSLLASDSPCLASDYDTAIITREQYEAALAARNEGWIEWAGGECPVEKGVLVDVRYRDGRQLIALSANDGTLNSRDASFVFWRNDGSEKDIIAYRLHQPQEAAQPKTDEEADLNECIGQDAAPVWSGEGLPPVGCECEVSVDGGRSWCTYKAINEKNGARLIEIGNFTEEFQNNNWIFRPIRSEADRKRDEAVQALCDAGGGNGKVDEKAGYGSCWFDIYDAIAAGEIPGVKLED